MLSDRLGNKYCLVWLGLFSNHVHSDGKPFNALADLVRWNMDVIRKED